jgi:hypothetical protein
MTDNFPKNALRRYLMISLRTLLVLIAVVAVWLGWITNRARRQAEVLNALEANGSTVGFDYQYPSVFRISASMPLRSAQPPAPAWLRKRVGEEYFRKIVAVDLVAGRVIDAVRPPREERVLAMVASLGGLRDLYVAGPNLRSRTFLEAGRFEALEELRISDCPNVSDEIFSAASQMPSLRWLRIDRCPISGSGLDALGTLNALEDLRLSSETLSEKHLGRLNAIPGLKSLFLQTPHLTDVGLAKLDLPNLRVLVIGCSRASGAGLATLAKHGRLEEVVFKGPLTDDSMATLRPLKNLRRLLVVPTEGALTDRALESLRDLTQLRDLHVGGMQGEFTDFNERAILDLVESLPSLDVLRIKRKHSGNNAFLSEIRKRKPRIIFDPL